MPISNESITLKESLKPKLLNSSYRKKKDVYPHAKNQLHSQLFLRYCKAIANLLFLGTLKHLTIQTKIMVLIYWKLLCFSACLKPSLSLSNLLLFIYYYNLLLFIIWACLALNS